MHPLTEFYPQPTLLQNFTGQNMWWYMFISKYFAIPMLRNVPTTTNEFCRQDIFSPPCSLA